MAKNGWWVLFGISMVLGLGVGISVLAEGLKKGGFLTLTDVGELPELADLQAKLMPLDLCRLEYAGRNKHGHRTSLDFLHVRPCSGSGNEGLVLRVGAGWGLKDVGYELTRGGPDERFKVLVEKDEVPFPDLLGAIAEHTPVIAGEYTQKLQEYRASIARVDAGIARQQEEEAARKAGAAGSYPTK